MILSIAFIDGRFKCIVCGVCMFSVFSFLYDEKVHYHVMPTCLSDALGSETQICKYSSGFLYWRKCARFGQSAPPP